LEYHTFSPVVTALGMLLLPKALIR
jgi:hypothetical protein